jgi:hypothetical protein
MSENRAPSAYETYQQQKEVARIRKRAMGADMTLDDAEVRHEAIWDMVHGLRFGIPYGAAALVGLIGPDPVGSLILCIACVLATFLVARVTGNMLHAVLAKFRPTIAEDTESFWLVVGGVAAMVGGFGSQRFGVAITGLAMMVTPILWKKLAQKVMSGTDYARLTQARRETAPPQLVE